MFEIGNGGSIRVFTVTGLIAEYLRKIRPQTHETTIVALRVIRSVIAKPRSWPGAL